MSWIKDLLFKRPDQWTYEPLPASAFPDQTQIRQLNKNQEYLHVKLKSTRIGYARKGLQTYYGVVHSYISLLHKGVGIAKFHSVNTPGNLQLLDAKKIGNVINIDKVLLGPVPYLGHTVDIEIGLLSIAADNMAKPFVQLLSEISNAAGVSVINHAIPFAAPIESGIKLLTGAQTAPSLEIGLSKSYDEIYTGYYAVIAAPEGTLKVSELTVGQDFSLMRNGKNLVEYPYFIFEISGSRQRDDWFNIEYINTAYEKLNDALKKPDVPEAQELLTNLRLLLYTSPDILRQDAAEIYKQLENDTNEIIAIIKGPKTRDVSLGRSELKKLSDYNIYNND